MKTTLILKNEIENKNLKGPQLPNDSLSKPSVDNKPNDPIIIKNSTNSDFNDAKLENKKFLKIHYQPAFDSHSTPKIYVDNSIDESTLVENNQDTGFTNHSSSKKSFIIIKQRTTC